MAGWRCDFGQGRVCLFVFSSQAETLTKGADRCGPFWTHGCHGGGNVTPDGGLGGSS